MSDAPEQALARQRPGRAAARAPLGARARKRAWGSTFSEINMTPLIDVMLVLLVIFIITAPLMASSLKLDLPKTEGARPTEAQAVIVLSVDPAGQFYVGDDKVSAEQLSARVRDAARRDPATEVQLRADKTVPYGRVAELIGLVQDGGLSRIGFITEAAK